METNLNDDGHVSEFIEQEEKEKHSSHLKLFIGLTWFIVFIFLGLIYSEFSNIFYFMSLILPLLTGLPVIFGQNESKSINKYDPDLHEISIDRKFLIN